MENKKLKVKDIVLFIIFLIFLILEIYLIIAWIPVKSAVKESDFYKHGNFILVTENVGTGTPWVKIGDINGFYTNNDDITDVYIDDKDNPIQYIMYYHEFNKYLCEVEEIPEGKYLEHLGMLKAYKVIQWYPVYPIKRDRVMFPEWIYPADFLNKHDFSMGGLVW
jgi:hypothetical protein